MSSERVTAAEGPRKKIAGSFTLWAVVLAGALSACGGSGSKSSAGPNPPPPQRTLQGIALDPPALTVGTGATPVFAVIGTYSDGTTEPIASGIAWSSSSPAVAELSGNGIASCTRDSTSAGTTIVTATFGAYSAQATLTVTPSALLSISVEPSSADITLAANQGFRAIGVFEGDDTPRPLGNVSWSSSDGSIAEVDSDGFARGVKKGGPVAITATHPSGASAFAVLNIVDGVLQALTISPAEGSVPVGFSRRLVAIGHFSDATSRPVQASWESSSEAVAEVESSGLAFGVAQGQAVITARAGGRTKTATLTVTGPVAPIPVAENDSETIDSNAPAAYRVSNLDPGREYLVRVSTKDDVDLTTLLFEVTDPTFTTRICSSWASGDSSPARSGGPPCRAGAADANGNVFVRLTGPVGTEFRFDVRPLPVVDVTGGVASRDGTVDDTETYYKVVGLPLGGTFQPTLLGASSFADLFAYDRAQGPFGFDVVTFVAPAILPGVDGDPAFPLVGSQRVVELGAPVPGALGTTAEAGFGLPKTFVATAPASGSAYLTVEGWLTPSGTDFSVQAVPFAPPPPLAP